MRKSTSSTKLSLLVHINKFKKVKGSAVPYVGTATVTTMFLASMNNVPVSP